MKNFRPIAVDLFAGAGGMSLGFEQAGFDVRTAVEIDPIHAAIHEFNFSNCAVYRNRGHRGQTFLLADVVSPKSPLPYMKYDESGVLSLQI